MPAVCTSQSGVCFAHGRRQLHLLTRPASGTALCASGLAAVQALARVHQLVCQLAWHRHFTRTTQGVITCRNKAKKLQVVLHKKYSVHLQAEGDEVAAKLLATRRETMRLRNKIKELKQQHAELRQMKEAQQQQLLASAETPEYQSAQTDSGDQIEAQEQQCTSELCEKVASDHEAMSCETASDVSEQSSAEL